jgi:hypothetical protein
MRPEFRTQQLSHHRKIDPPKFTEPPGAYKEPSDTIVDDNSELSSSSVNARRSRCGPGNSENTSFFVLDLEGARGRFLLCQVPCLICSRTPYSIQHILLLISTAPRVVARSAFELLLAPSISAKISTVRSASEELLSCHPDLPFRPLLFGCISQRPVLSEAC